MNDELIDKHWDINVSYDWWDFTYEQFKIDMLAKGITVDEMYFTGFYSQGDGASFIGRVDMIAFLKAHDLDHKYMAGTFFAEQGELWAEITRGSSRYSHENSVVINLTVDSYNNYAEGSTRYEVYETMQEVLDTEIPDLEKEVEDICKNYMRSMYTMLQE